MGATIAASDERAVRLKPTVAALLIGALISQIEINVVGTAMPDISAELGDFALYPWVFACYLVSYTAFVPLSGMLNDTFGRRATYVTGMFLISAGSVVCGLATSMHVLIVGRLIQGAGAGGMFVTTQTIFGDLFTTERRARMQSAVTLVAALGAITGPALGGWFVTYATWRWCFFITLPIVAAASVLFIIGFIEKSGRGKRAVNWRGALLMTATLALLLVGIGQGHVNPWLLAGAAAVGALFFYFERNATRPVLPPDLFLSSAFRMCAVIMFFVGATQVALVVFLPTYLQGVAGVSPAASGYFQAVPMVLTASASAYFLGTFVKRRGYRAALGVGAACAPLAVLSHLVAASLYDPASSAIVPAIFVSLAQALLGVCYGFAITAAIICVQNQVEQARRGAATASVHLIRSIGSVLAPAILGYLLVVALRDQHLGIPPEQFLNQKHLPELVGSDPAALAAARGALGEALRSLLPVILGISCFAFIGALFFPKAVTDVQEKS